MGTKIITFLILFISLAACSLSGQNLVVNPSFEEYTIIPKGPKGRGKLGVENWNRCKNTTPDLFSNKIRNSVWIPNNFMGTQFSKSGNSYIGIIAIDMGSYGKYREAIFTKLKEKLRTDKKYCVSMFVSLAEKSDYCTSDLGILITRKNLNGSYEDIIPKSRYNEIERKQLLKKIIYHDTHKIKVIDNMEWVKICGIYTAEGNEQYLTIGCFQDKVSIKKSVNFNQRNNSLYKRVAYYYIDDVSVVQVESPENCNCQPIESVIEEPVAELKAETPAEQEIIKLDTIAVGQNIVLNNIYFALNDSALLDSSFAQLNKLYKTLNSNPTLKIEIAGHSDNTGSAEYNQKLSEARAKAVISYLLQKGIEQKRLSFKGYGNTKPVANNSTEQGRQQNRRVEFVIIAK
jgi:outer membrane protein OmpA-like peptidoglycan-associated protein